MLFSDSLKIDLLGIFTALVALLLACHKWRLGYFKRRGIPGPEPTLLIGNLKPLIIDNISVGQLYANLYFDLKAKGHRHGGSYFINSPTYIPVHLDLVKAIFQTDFQHFHSRGVFYNEKADPLSVNIFNLEGERWRDIRTKVTPSFTIGKIKKMHETIVYCSEILKHVLTESARNNPVDIKDVMVRFSTDVIGSYAFGLDTNCLKNPKAEVGILANKLFEPNLSNIVRYAASLIFPHSFLRTMYHTLIPKYFIDYFYNMIMSTIKYREENNITRNDLMNLLLKLKRDDNNKDVKATLTLDEIAAQCYVFFIAGFETTATTVSFASYELAANPEIQEKTRDEINRVLDKYNNEMTYEALMEMEYLEKVILETLRKHPPLQFLFRKCTKNYAVPGENVELEEGTDLMIPVLGIHYDPEYYPDPHKFDPDRFSDENKRKRHQFAFLPFGEGPRICIGLRLGIFESKIAIITLIKNFKVSLNERTLSPVVYKNTGLVSTCVGGIWLDLESTSVE